MNLKIENFTLDVNLEKCGIYMISHKSTDLKYIGSTFQKRGFKGRWLQHLNGLKRNVGNKVLLNIYNKYGLEGFKFSII